ncbi:MAG: T9SS type A sorting domain-containing protein, partial [Ignavibacteriae bacterium]|nr:T9SS type A sorting domain-containing protein [Ignavibacteriota bacterium]
NFGCEINIISRSTNYCFGTQTFLVSNLISGSKTFSYSSSDFVSIVVENLFSGFINTYTFTISRSELPVELTTFTASVLEHNVELIWETATEVNNYGFEVERKYQESSIKNSDASTSLSMTVVPSGDEGWETLAFVEGHGNSNSPKYYSFTDKSIEASGQYLYRLKQIDIDGTFEYSDAVEVNFGAPEDFVLNQNYPNPFNPTTSIQFTIPLDSRVRLSVFNVLGEEVAELVNQNFAAGYHSVDFNGSKLNSGIYFYKLEANNFMQIRKMMLVK